MPREPFSPQVAERLRQDNFKDSLEVCGELVIKITFSHNLDLGMVI